MSLTPDDLAAVRALMREEIAAAFTIQTSPFPSIVATNELGMVQTSVSRELLPNVWLYVNLQFNDGVVADAANAWRVALNVGCNAKGVLQPAAMRGFEQADGVEEQAMLDRCNATVLVYDIKAVTINGADTYTLDPRTPIIDTLGIKNETGSPIVYALRAKSWADVDAWCVRTAESRAAREAARARRKS